MQDDRSLSVGSLLEGVVDLLRRHPVPLLVPLLVLGLLGAGGGAGSGTGDEFSEYADAGSMSDEEIAALIAIALAVLVTLVVVLVILALLYIVAGGITTAAALDATGGGEPSIGPAFDAMRSRFGALLGTGFLAFIATIGGFLLFIVPGIILTVGWLPWMAVVMGEGRSGTDALRRSWELTRGHRMNLFLLVLVGFVLSSVGSGFGLIPFLGAIVSGLVSGVVSAAMVVLGALFYVRRTAAEGAGGPGEQPPPDPDDPSRPLMAQHV